MDQHSSPLEEHLHLELFFWPNKGEDVKKPFSVSLSLSLVSVSAISRQWGSRSYLNRNNLGFIDALVIYLGFLWVRFLFLPS